MSDEFNTDQVYKTLKEVLTILQKYNVQYWFMGSIIPTALNGELFRTVNDLDIVLEEKDSSQVISDLKKLGYTRKDKNIYRVSEQLGVYTFVHPSLLEVGFFLVSEEKENYLIKAGIAKIVIPKSKLKTQKYRLRDLTFFGIPQSVAYTFSALAKDNPKRQKELALYKKLGITPAPWPPYNFYLFGFKANWVINILNLSLVIIGKIRVRLGKPYDPWR